jgi:hypothetical protein
LVARRAPQTEPGTSGAAPGDPRDGTFPDLRGVVRGDLIVIIGERALLPWAEGCIYLGRSPDAPGVYYPTLLRPDAPLALHARATVGRADSDDLPLAWVDPDTLVPLGAARPIEVARLSAWLDDGAGSRRSPRDGRGDP